MANTFPEVEVTSPDAFAKLGPHRRNVLRERRRLMAEWVGGFGPAGRVIVLLRDRANATLNRARIFLVLLFLATVLGLGYFVGVPLWSDYQDAARAALEARTVSDENALRTQTSELASRFYSTRNSISGSGSPQVENFTLEIDYLDSDTSIDFSKDADSLIAAIRILHTHFPDLAGASALAGDADALMTQKAALEARRAEYSATGINLGSQDIAVVAAAAAVDAASNDSERAEALKVLEIALTKARTEDWWRYLGDRIPAGILLLFLLATLGSLYRYNVRMAGFYHARADALELMELELDREQFDKLSDTLAADQVEFKGTRTPADMATEITKEVISKLDLKPKA